MLFVGGIPLFYMELALGQVRSFYVLFFFKKKKAIIIFETTTFVWRLQFYRKGAITSWGRIVPLFKGNQFRFESISAIVWHSANTEATHIIACLFMLDDFCFWTLRFMAIYTVHPMSCFNALSVMLIAMTWDDGNVVNMSRRWHLALPFNFSRAQTVWYLLFQLLPAYFFPT